MNSLFIRIEIKRLLLTNKEEYYQIVVLSRKSCYCYIQSAFLLKRMGLSAFLLSEIHWKINLSCPKVAPNYNELWNGPFSFCSQEQWWTSPYFIFYENINRMILMNILKSPKIIGEVGDWCISAVFLSPPLTLQPIPPSLFIMESFKDKGKRQWGMHQAWSKGMKWFKLSFVELRKLTQTHERDLSHLTLCFANHKNCDNLMIFKVLN